MVKAELCGRGVRVGRVGVHGQISEPQLVALQARQGQQARQAADALTLAGEGAAAETLQVAGEEGPATRSRSPIAVPLPLPQHPRAHRHLRPQPQQAQQPGREAEAGGGGEEGRAGEAA